MRANCYRCLKPEALCLCARIPRVENRTEVLILQHPKERRHPFGTARIARLGLARCAVHVPNPKFADSLAHPLDTSATCALLYPHPEARDLAELPADQMPSQLVVLDGTWAHARRLYKDNPWLHALPHVQLTPAQPSRYRIRREPDPMCISTIEAIVQSLRHIEPDTQGLDGLIAAFDDLIDDHLDTRPQRRHGPRRVRARERPFRAVPPPLLEDAHRIVAVYGEFSQQQDPDAPRPRDLLQWTAVRLGTGEVFERFVEPAAPPQLRDAAWPDDHYLGLLQLHRRDLAGAVHPTSFLEDWQQFARPADVLATWTRGTFDLLDQARGTAPPPSERRIVLKTAYTNVHNKGCGTLEETMAREGLRCPQIALSGRASTRIGNALAVVTWLRDVARARSCAPPAALAEVP